MVVGWHLWSHSRWIWLSCSSLFHYHQISIDHLYCGFLHLWNIFHTTVVKTLWHYAFIKLQLRHWCMPNLRIQWNIWVCGHCTFIIVPWFRLSLSLVLLSRCIPHLPNQLTFTILLWFTHNIYVIQINILANSNIGIEIHIIVRMKIAHPYMYAI